ncbi:glycoside hydrolase superfamily, partial [Lophiotrema nucula]
GFSYGAFWTNKTAKYKADFARQFNLAKSLQTSVSLNSARLFTCVQWNTKDDPIQAFEAAIDTDTTLLLGLYNIGDDTIFANEVSALEKGLQQHGQKLANLIVGISVGNEDIYRNSSECKSGDSSGQNCLWSASADVVTAKVNLIRSEFQSGAPFANYFNTIPPIGHTDVAQRAGEVEGVDFAGTTIYPFHAAKGVANAKGDFLGAYDMVKANAGGLEVWVTETGWPVAGDTKGQSIPGVEYLQTYWKDVGCSIFGTYNVWWFELE